MSGARPQSRQSGRTGSRMSSRKSRHRSRSGTTNGETSNKGRRKKAVRGSRSVIAALQEKGLRELTFQMHAVKCKSRIYERDNPPPRERQKSKRPPVPSADISIKRAPIDPAVRYERSIRNASSVKLTKHDQRWASSISADKDQDEATLRRSVTHKLNKLRANIDMKRLGTLLPAYDGDHFGTRGDYMNGLLYMSHMTPAKDTH